jgi:hypothetical protein
MDRGNSSEAGSCPGEGQQGQLLFKATLKESEGSSVYMESSLGLWLLVFRDKVILLICEK